MADTFKNDHSLFNPSSQVPTPVSEQDFPGITTFLKRIVCCSSPTSENDYPQNVTEIDSLKVPQKRGRKPKACSCSLCSRSFPYKYALIAHLQGDHDITRSTSVMYKRILQGKRVLKRLQKKVEGERTGLAEDSPVD